MRELSKQKSYRSTFQKNVIWIWSSIFLRVWGHFEKGLVQVGECDHCERGKCYLQMMVASRGRFSWQLSNQYTLHPKHHLYTLYLILYTFHFTPIQSIHFTLFTFHQSNRNISVPSWFMWFHSLSKQSSTLNELHGMFRLSIGCIPGKGSTNAMDQLNIIKTLPV